MVRSTATVAMAVLAMSSPARAVELGSHAPFCGPVFSPAVFAPGAVSGPAHDSAPAFTPDGDTVYFGRCNAAQPTIFVSHRRDGKWSEPDIAPFSGQWNDMEPAFAPDRSWLVFVSNHPAAPAAT